MSRHGRFYSGEVTRLLLAQDDDSKLEEGTSEEFSLQFSAKNQGKRLINSDPKLGLCRATRASTCSIFFRHLKFTLDFPVASTIPVILMK